MHAGGDGEPRRLMARTPFVTQPVSTLHHRSAHRGPATISGENCETPCGPAGSCSAAASATAVPGCSTGAAVGCVGLDERLLERPPPVRVRRPPGPSTGRSVLFRHAHRSGDGPATRPDPDVALTGATEAIFDWEGGTRIGESIHTFDRTWGGPHRIPGRRGGHLLRRAGVGNPTTARKRGGPAAATISADHFASRESAR